jgi:myosin-1
VLLINLLYINTDSYSYTLAVGKAPFHAAKREEIYKKLQNREYEWPDLSKHQNDISNNLRDLVGSLLVDEDDRPDPDQIVSHSFFKMAYIPEFLDSSCKAVRPSWANIRPPNAETIRRGYSESWFKFCKISGVGEFAPGRFFPVIGAATIASVVKDVEREIKANKAPTVPIAAGTVYLPFISERKDKSSRGSNNLSGITEERESSGADSAHLIEISGNDRGLRQNAESSKTQPSRRLKENLAPISSPPVDEPETGANIRRARSTKGRVESKRVGSRDMAPPQTQRVPSDPARPSAKLVIERSEPAQPQRRPRLPRANSNLKSTAVAQEEEVVVVDVKARPTMTVIPEPEAPSPKARKLMLERPVRSRTARPVTQIEQPAPLVAEKPETSRREPIPVKEEDPELPMTDPTSVLARATQFRDSLLAAIQCKEKNIKMKKDLEQLPFVSKWVDYSKKHGVGYVLADGGVGCVFNATSRQPVTHVMVRNGHSYLKKRSNEPINISQIPLEFYSHATKDAIRVVQLEGDRRRLNGILWAKFGNYMCQTLSGGDNKRTQPKESLEEDKLIVSYYQRLGTVGVWGFSRGCFQFNFPDHTKIVIAADGKTCSFTCLQVEAMEYISQHGDLPMKHIKARETLSGSIQCLLHNAGERKAMMRANLLQEKIQFIADIANLWVTGGGLGCRPVGAQWPRWPGPHLEDAGGKKVDWITVGRYGGDLDEGAAE